MFHVESHQKGKTHVVSEKQNQYNHFNWNRRYYGFLDNTYTIKKIQNSSNYIKKGNEYNHLQGQSVTNYDEQSEAKKFQFQTVLNEYPLKTQFQLHRLDILVTKFLYANNVPFSDTEELLSNQNN